MNHILGVQVYHSNIFSEVKWVSQILFVFVILVGISILPPITVIPIYTPTQRCIKEPVPNFQFLLV